MYIDYGYFYNIFNNLLTLRVKLHYMPCNNVITLYVLCKSHNIVNKI